MHRPENVIDPKSLPSTVTTARRLLAYLLRATMMRVRANVIGDHRYNSVYSELEHALVPLVVSERSTLAFYRALCTRFCVEATGGEDDYGPVEIWMPIGRMRWDKAIGAIDYRHLRLVVHENPAFLATFAKSSTRDMEEPELQAEYESFDCFPEPGNRGSYRAQLPEQLIQTRSFRTVWTLTSPMAHGADEKSGNVNLFRRHRVINVLTGEHAYVPFVAGNAVRGLLRDMVMGRWLGLLGLKPHQIPSARAHALLAGGNIEAGADTGSVRVDVRKRARDLCPPWDLLGGCTDQQIMQGRARIHDAVLVCRENAWQVHQALGVETAKLDEWAASLPEAAELTQLRLGTRHAHKDLPGAEGSQMLFNVELLLAGTQMMHSFQVFSLDGVSEVTASCLSDLLEDFMAYGVVGAQNARGMGLISFNPYQPGPGTTALPDPTIYLEYVLKHADEMTEWAMMRGEPEAPMKAAKWGAKRGRKQAAPAATDEELSEVKEAF